MRLRSRRRILEKVMKAGTLEKTENSLEFVQDLMKKYLRVYIQFTFMCKWQ